MLPSQDEMEEILKSDKKFVTCVTTVTDAGSSDSSSSHSSSPNEKSDEVEDKKDSIKDSLLSKELADKLQCDLAFDEISGEWYRCQEGIWKPITKIRATRIINNKLHTFLPEGFSMAKLNAIEGFLKLYLALDAWESDKTLLPMQNGVLDTKTMMMASYSASHKFNWQLPYGYDSKAEIKVIKQWLWNVTSQDMEVVNIIRAFFKITLVGGDVQKFLEIVGPGGTGKSTLIRLLILLIGESNHAATDLRNLEQNRFEAATLYNKRLATISDSYRYGGEVSVLKAITGGDPVRHERKNQQQSGSFVFDGTVVIASNEAIQSTDYSSGLARRRLPIAFVKKVTDEDKAKYRHLGGIENAMRKELPGLINWVLSMSDEDVNAAIGSINGNLSKAQREHLIETNKLAAWIDDNLIVKEDNIIYIGNNSPDEADFKLYPNYARWCEQHNVSPIAVNRFSLALMDISEHLKFPVKKINKDRNGQRIQGLKIRNYSDDKIKTPITSTSLSDEVCRTCDELKTQQTRMSDDGDECDELNLSEDTEVI